MYVNLYRPLDIINCSEADPEQPRDDVYGAYDASFMSDNGPKQNTQQPIVTGTSVIAVKFKDGVVMAADNLGPSYLSYTNTVTKSN